MKPLAVFCLAVACLACGDATGSEPTPTSSGELQTPTPSPSPVAPHFTVKFLNAPLTVPRGHYATLQANTAPNTSCSIDVEYSSGPSTAAGLVDKKSSSAGSVSWTWKVGAHTTPGTWPITATCGA